jgi:hypothetical protein
LYTSCALFNSILKLLYWITCAFVDLYLYPNVEYVWLPVGVALSGVLAVDKTSKAPLRHTWRLTHIPTLYIAAMSQRRGMHRDFLVLGSPCL